jgi:hypothetical protein
MINFICKRLIHIEESWLGIQISGLKSGRGCHTCRPDIAIIKNIETGLKLRRITDERKNKKLYRAVPAVTYCRQHT